MHIEHELKLDFRDVLIRPKRSTLTSRSDVDISRQFTFRHAAVPYDGIPIIASNMDTTGTFKMVKGDLRKEAYDLRQVSDALYVMKPGATVYEPLDEALAAQIEAGQAGF